MKIIGKKKSQPISKQKAFMFFTTIADVGALFVALIYVSYVGIMMYMRPKAVWLDWVMLSITLLYIIFFVFKILVLNKTMTHVGRIKRIVKFANKYTKLGMRIINAAFVILSLIGSQRNDAHAFALVGVLVVGVTFIVSILWDIGNFVLRRKIQEFTIAWDTLSQEEKSERIELLLTGFIRSINNAAILDDYFDIGMNVKKMVGTKLGDRIRLADARRIEAPQDLGKQEEDEEEFVEQLAAETKQ